MYIVVYPHVMSLKEKKITTYGVGNPVVSFGQVQKKVVDILKSTTKTQ